jgi:two-component system, NarL family, response regulator NreC
VLVMDDHVVVREGLRALLEPQEGIVVLGEAGSVGEAIALDVSPNVVVADLVLPDERGAEVVCRLKERHPHAAILVLTMIDNPTDVQMCLAAGASGYLLKETASTELVDAVRKGGCGARTTFSRRSAPPSPCGRRRPDGCARARSTN